MEIDINLQNVAKIMPKGKCVMLSAPTSQRKRLKINYLHIHLKQLVHKMVH